MCYFPRMDHEVTPKDLALAVGGFALRGAYRWIRGVLSDRKNKGLSAQQQEQYHQLLEQLRTEQVEFRHEMRTDLSRLKDVIDEIRNSSAKKAYFAGDLTMRDTELRAILVQGRDDLKRSIDSLAHSIPYSE